MLTGFAPTALNCWRIRCATLRHYARATPLDDVDVADHIDDLVNAVIG